MKSIYTKLLLLLLILISAEVAHGQSLKWAGTNQEYVRKIGDNLYEPVPAGVISFKIDKNQCWVLFQGEPETTMRGYFNKDNYKITYYDKDHNIVGYYFPSSNKYSIVSADKETVLKEVVDSIIIVDDILYYNGTERYLIDKKFDPIIVGAFLFIF